MPTIPMKELISIANDLYLKKHEENYNLIRAKELEILDTWLPIHLSKSASTNPRVQELQSDLHELHVQKRHIEKMLSLVATFQSPLNQEILDKVEDMWNDLLKPYEQDINKPIP
jgi:FPC/CPF motif-containing protein YcgG